MHQVSKLTKAYCHHKARCVKCAGPHATETCLKPQDEPAKCSLCQKDHSASYRGCELFKNLKKVRSHFIASKSSEQTRPLPPEFQNLDIFPNSKTPAHATESQPSASKTQDRFQDSTRTFSEITIQKSQVPQTSQPKPLTSHPQPQPPRHQNAPYHLPLRLKLPLAHPLPVPSRPAATTNSSSQPLKSETAPHNPAPHISRLAQPSLSTSCHTNYPSQAPDPYPHHQNPMDITSMLTSFLKDLQDTIKPLINLLTRILSEIPLNFPR
nr:uncharacterized protein LOC106678771 [Halyomorpha halys]